MSSMLRDHDAAPQAPDDVAQGRAAIVDEDEALARATLRPQERVIRGDDPRVISSHRHQQ